MGPMGQPESLFFILDNDDICMSDVIVRVVVLAKNRMF